MDIDIYDFDKTVVPFDSGSRFIIYCYIHYPWAIITLPVVLLAGLLALCRVINFTSFKKICFCCVMLIPLDKAVKGFWDKNERYVHKWFLSRKRHSVVISASPDFLLKEIQDRLGFEDLICSRHNKKTGTIISENCRGKEKVNRLYELFDKDTINVIDVYSDSLKHDRPIFSLGQNCFQIVDGKQIKFDYNKIYG